MLRLLFDHASEFWLDIVPVAQYASSHHVRPFLRAHLVHFSCGHDLAGLCHAEIVSRGCDTVPPSLRRIFRTTWQDLFYSDLLYRFPRRRAS